MQSFFIQSLYPWKKLTQQNERHKFGNKTLHLDLDLDLDLD